jgi:hypothetical protein
MLAGGRGKAADDGAQGRGGQPLMNAGADDAGPAASSLTGNDQHRLIASRLTPQQKGGQHILSFEAAIAVQVQSGINRVAFARQTALSAGFQGFRLASLAHRTRAAGRA